jgi:hypothetical protein
MTDRIVSFHISNPDVGILEQSGSIEAIQGRTLGGDATEGIFPSKARDKAHNVGRQASILCYRSEYADGKENRG